MSHRRQNGIVGRTERFFLPRRILSGLVGLLLLMPFGRAGAAEEGAQRETQVRLYFNNYLPRYTNTPLLIRRDCNCQLGYQQGIGVDTRFFNRFSFHLHGYALGGTPGMGESNEQFGARFEGQYHFNRFSFLVGHHGEWNVDRPSNFPNPSGEESEADTASLRETYIGVTWWIK